MEEKKKYVDVLESSSANHVEYRKVLKQVEDEDLIKARDILLTMENTKTKIKFIEQELRMRSMDEIDNRKKFPEKLKKEWDETMAKFRRRG